MNWIRENKFLTGFIAVLVVGVAILGYLLYSAYDDFSEVSDQYTAQANKLNQLQSLTPYPDEANLVKYRAELDKVNDATQALATNLSHMVIPAPPMSPAEFQDKLRASVSSISAKAQQLGVKLPDKFFLGFDGYQSQPPRAEAAAALGQELAAIEHAINVALDNHVDAITALNRPPLPQEQAAAAPAHPAGGPGGGFGPGARGPGPAGKAKLVEKIPFTISFLATQANFQKVLNAIGASGKQFFIVRTLVVKNDNPKPVAKVDASAPTPTPDAGAGAAPAASPAPGASPSGDAGYLKFIVGTEKLEISMQIDIAKFNPPAPAARHGAAH